MSIPSMQCTSHLATVNLGGPLVRQANAIFVVGRGGNLLCPDDIETPIGRDHQIGVPATQVEVEVNDQKGLWTPVTSAVGYDGADWVLMEPLQGDDELVRNLGFILCDDVEHTPYIMVPLDDELQATPQFKTLGWVAVISSSVSSMVHNRNTGLTTIIERLMAQRELLDRLIAEFTEEPTRR